MESEKKRMSKQLASLRRREREAQKAYDASAKETMILFDRLIGLKTEVADQLRKIIANLEGGTPDGN